MRRRPLQALVRPAWGCAGMGLWMSARNNFRLVLIKPSHYDDEGYVIQWLRSAIPSNTLAAL